MLSKILILLSISLFALAVPLQERTVSEILADVSVFGTDLANISNDLNSLPTTGANELAVLQADTNSLISDVEKATADVEANGILNEDDGQTVATAVSTAAEDLIEALNLFENTHGTFENLSADVPGLIQNTEAGIEGIATVVEGFVNGLNEISPSDIVSAAAPLMTAVFDAFDNAIATFQS